MAKNLGATIAVLTTSLVLAGCSANQEALEAAPATSPASPEATEAPAEPITLEPMGEAEWQSIYDLEDFNDLQGSAGLVYSTKEAIVFTNGHPECGQTIDNVSLIRDVITFEVSANSAQAHSRGANASLAGFAAQVTDASCGSEPIVPSFYKLAVSDPLFIPGQSYPVTLRAEGENHLSQLIWKDAKK